MKIARVVHGVLVAVVAVAGAAHADILMEVDFSGTAPSGVGTIPASDGQITLNSAVTFTALASIGGSSSTAAWVYDGTGTAAANTDLHTASTFGAPTRFDIDLGWATLGNSYAITNVEIVVRASNSAGTEWDFGYRDGGGTTHLVSGGLIATQSGADPLTTYSIDLSGEGLSATDSAATWNLTGTGRLRVAFFEPTATGNDNLQIDAIRLNGTVVPEPAALGLIVIMGGGFLFVRRLMS